MIFALSLLSVLLGLRVIQLTKKNRSLRQNVSVVIQRLESPPAYRTQILAQLRAIVK